APPVVVEPLPVVVVEPPVVVVEPVPVLVTLVPLLLEVELEPPDPVGQVDAVVRPLLVVFELEVPFEV
ncbi:MAG: hypothetical protein M3Z66_25445, partial [Chloroflexota bacterium]|nr:hypothetical protein [Chloroflexota bacterium]